MAWDFEQDKPIYIQIVNRIKLGILSGQYRPGDKLESVRELASIAGVNPNTMQKALQELENISLVYSQRTSGRFITDNNDVISALRKKVAGEKIMAFIENMLNLGFSKEEIEEMIKDYLLNGDSAFKVNEFSINNVKKSKAVGSLEDLLKEGEL